MVIHPTPGQNESYMIRMLNRNKIFGLLSFQEKQVDGNTRFYYDITSKQPLDRIMEKRSLTAKEFRRLISDLIFTLRQMERFLLDEGQLSLKPEHIYVEPDVFRGSFCLIPGKYGDFPTDFGELAQYLLDHVNHSDGEAVVLAFSIFKECRKENFGIDDIERCLAINGEKEVGSETPVEKKEEKAVPELWEEENVQEDSRPEEESQKEKVQRKIPKNELPREIAVITIIIGMILIPAIMFLLMGIGKFLQWGKRILVCELLLTGLLAVVLKENGTAVMERENDEVNAPGSSERGEEDLWKVYFKELDNNEEKEWQSRTESSKNLDAEEENLQTVLLTAPPKNQEVRSLAPINGGPEISIGYYPFLIGKNKGLSDFCLNEEGISRLHVKIEKTEHGYFVTDLNSTNGTKINGELLEANETRELPLGSELAIAAVRYRFR